LAQRQGWTQPSRVGWADVPARRRRKETHDWLLLRMHSNRLIIFFLHAECAQCTFCRQEGELGPAARGEEELPEAVISGG